MEESVAIPPTVDELLAGFSVVDAAPYLPEFDFMWNATKEEGREQALLSHALTLRVDERPFAMEGNISEQVGMAESVLKVTYLEHC
jgi:transcription factor C subunit 3